MRFFEHPVVQVTGIVLVVVLGGVLLASAISYGPVRWSCNNKASLMGLPSHYSLTTGCLVEVDGRWWPLRQVQNVNGHVDTGG